jgi:hypothetical protein
MEAGMFSNEERNKICVFFNTGTRKYVCYFYGYGLESYECDSFFDGVVHARKAIKQWNNNAACASNIDVYYGDSDTRVWNMYGPLKKIYRLIF